MIKKIGLQCFFLLQNNETFQKGNARILYLNTNICKLIHRIKEKQNRCITTPKEDSGVMHITPESPYCECYNVAYSVSASKQGQDLLLMDLIKYYKKKYRWFANWREL